MRTAYKKIAKCINSIPWIQNYGYEFYFDVRGNKGLRPLEKGKGAPYDAKTVDTIMAMADGAKYYDDYLKGKK